MTQKLIKASEESIKTDFEDPCDLIDEWYDWASDREDQGKAIPDDDLLDVTETFTGTPDQAVALLVRWYRWWRDCDAAPVKLPDALHVRTAMNLWHAGKLEATTLELID